MKKYWCTSKEYEKRSLENGFFNGLKTLINIRYSGFSLIIAINSLERYTKRHILETAIKKLLYPN